MSSDMTDGKFSSSLMRCAIRAPTLKKSKVCVAMTNDCRPNQERLFFGQLGRESGWCREQSDPHSEANYISL